MDLASASSSASSYGTAQEEKEIAFEHRSYFAYEELQTCAVDDQLQGPQFVTRHDCYFFKWQLYLIPKAKEDNKFGLYLLPIDRQENISAKFELFCGKEKEVEDEQISFQFKKDDVFCWGAPEFLPSVESLQEKGLVVGGVVTMGVKIILNVADFDPLKWIRMPSLTPNTGCIARKLFANLNTGDRHLCDFTILVGNDKTELHVNRVALQEVPFFDRLFGRADDGWKENREGILSLPTFHVDVVKEALRFVYLKEIGDNLLTRFGLPLLDLANQLELSDLKTAIERELMEKLLRSNPLNSSDLALTYLQLADLYHLEGLRRVTICRSIEMWPQFINSAKGRNMANHLKDELIESAMSACSGGGVFV